MKAVLTALMRVLRATGGLLLALVLLFEEWGWRPLAELLSLLARYRPWARIEAVIAALPPYPALIAFALPSLLLLPVKLGALWLLAQGKAVTAAALLVAAKIAGTALVARIFLLTRPALMRLRWFAWAYDRLMPWKEAIYARIRSSWAWRYGRMLKTWARHEARKAWLRWRPRLAAAWQHLRPAWAAAKLRLRLVMVRLKRARGGEG